MKRIVQFAVDYPVSIVMLVCAVVLLGVISFNRLGMDLFPNLNNPRLYIELTAGERPPEEIEKQYVKNIESMAIRQKNAVQISSVSQVGAAQVTVEYAWNTNMDEAFLDLQKALSDIKQNDEIEEFLISQHDPNAAPIILFGFSHPSITDMDELRKAAESHIRNELIRLEGIADVRLLGEEEREVVVQTDPYMLEAFNLTASTVASKIQAFNRNVSSGSIVEMGTKYIIKGVSEFASIDDIKNVIIAYQEPETAAAGALTDYTDKIPVYLKDVATVKYSNKEPDNIVRIDGKRALGIAVYKETNYNTVNAVKEFTNTLQSIKRKLPGYQFTLIKNQGAFVSSAIHEVQQTLLFGILLAVIVLYVFLRRIGVTAIVSISIPVSIIATFNLMYFNGLTINIMTLGGLALGAGMLVDNAIVVMENISRNLEEGLSLREACIEGTSQMSGPITASTVTTIIVFLPIVYLHGSAGELFKDQAWTVAFSLLSSLAVALLVIPMLSSRFLKSVAAEKQKISPVRFSGYANFLRKALDKKWLVIIAALALMGCCWFMLRYTGSEFIPKTDNNEYSIDIKLPEGTELFRTESTVASIENNIKTAFKDKIQTLYSISGETREIGGDENSIFHSENTASFKLVFKKTEKLRSDSVMNVLNTMLANIPDLEVNVYQEQIAVELTTGSETLPVVVEIQGEDLDIIRGLSDTAKKKVEQIKDIYNIKTSFDQGRPEVNIEIDPVMAGLYNLSLDNVVTQLENILMGTDAGQWDAEGELMDITIKLPKVDLNSLKDVQLTSGNSNVSLYSIAKLNRSQAPREIFRHNQVRTGKITAHIATGKPLDAVAKEIRQALADMSIPPDYQYQITGEEQVRKEAFGNLKFALILSLVLVYMVLASQFESMIHPFIIILSIPLAAVGAVAIFFFMGKSFSIMAYIGIIMLAGIAVNNSIILVDAINNLRKEGRSRIDAIVEAGQKRIRPIIMTSLTTILALLPLTIGFGEGSALRAPMALAVIGGLFTSTLLTLVVIPCIYAVIDRKKD